MMKRDEMMIEKLRLGVRVGHLMVRLRRKAISARALKPFVASLAALALVTLAASCGTEGSQTADNGGIGGTGISQGTITAFGSIFVNGVEWELDRADIELDGAVASETDLRIGMRVRVIGDFSGDGRTGSAASVRFDDSVEGPIAGLPVLTSPGGSEKSFTILGQTILVDEFDTVFADGAAFASLAMDQILEVSGFGDGPTTIRASRVSLRGVFPGIRAVNLSGSVLNLLKNPDGSGIFEISGITIRYLATTSLEGLDRDSLDNGVFVDVAGDLRASGTELDADEIEREDESFGVADLEDIEVEGVVSSFVSLGDFELDGSPVDASSATLDPPGLVVADGAFIEVEGRLESGVIVAIVLKSEEAEEDEIEIRASITAINVAAREVTILGVTVFADGETEIQDERDGDENFLFGEIVIGDWLKIEGFEDGTARVRAKQIVRNSVEANVVLRGPVTELDRPMLTFSVLDQMIPSGPGTAFFDDMGQPRTEEEFLRTPGDVNLDDVVVVTDENALNPEVLDEADRVVLD